MVKTINLLNNHEHGESLKCEIRKHDIEQIVEL